ncbi:hypothetical protein SISNIDRAFT_465596 [Sistotremastrum niveocremeum HHB9708]|uniref:Extracellular membrane protein CFEM domain-containing protein n=1 Tax=Sistotremastrum niveocremeum HHB9708 TaxID=1314777 RepID=A0A164VCI7_9AGAM|nr:hypothetical protein SISNIDRAFT_465596 [Sistotremastrum niveocremeum HHB9708]
MHLPAFSLGSLLLAAWSGPGKRDGSNALQARQTGDPFAGLPAQCDNFCQPADSAVTGCADDSCLCTASNFNDITQCFQCSINAVQAPASLVAQIQGELDTLVSDCDGEGFQVPSQSVTAPAGGATSGAPTGSQSSPIFSTPLSSGSTIPVSSLSSSPTTGPSFIFPSSSFPTSASSETTSSSLSIPPQSKSIFSSVPTNSQTTSSSSSSTPTPSVVSAGIKTSISSYQSSFAVVAGVVAGFFITLF